MTFLIKWPSEIVLVFGSTHPMVRQTSENSYCNWDNTVYLTSSVDKEELIVHQTLIWSFTGRAWDRHPITNHHLYYLHFLLPHIYTAWHKSTITSWQCLNPIQNTVAIYRQFISFNLSLFSWWIKNLCFTYSIHPIKYCHCILILTINFQWMKLLQICSEYYTYIFTMKAIVFTRM